MEGAKEVRLMRRFAHSQRRQRQIQTARHKRTNLRKPPCENRAAMVVPDQDRKGGAGASGDGADDGAVGGAEGGEVPDRKSVV